MTAKSNDLLTEIVAKLGEIQAALEEMKTGCHGHPVVVVLSDSQVRKLAGTLPKKVKNANATKQKPQARS